MRDIQYLRGWEYPSDAALAGKIVAAYDDARGDAGPGAKA